MTTIALPDRDDSPSASGEAWDDVYRLLMGYENQSGGRMGGSNVSYEPYAPRHEFSIDSLQLASTDVGLDEDPHDSWSRRHLMLYAIGYIAYRQQAQLWGSDLEKDHFVFVTEGGQNRHDDLLELVLSYEKRIAELKRYGADEGVSLNAASLEDFWFFVGYKGTRQRAGLVLLDNGNLRASWRDDDGNFLGIQFAGHRQVEYVIFKHRRHSELVSRVAGIDTLDGIRKQLQAFELVSLVNS